MNSKFFPIKAILIAFTLFALIPNKLHSTIYYVASTRANDAGDGLSWAAAKQTFQAALDLAVSGDQIWVAKGTYKPTKDASGNASPANNRLKCFVMKNGVAFYGGFAGNESSIENRDFITNETIFSGDLNNDDNYSTNPWSNISENCYHLFFNNNNGITASAIIDGFTIQGGNADQAGDPHGRGGAFYNVVVSPTFRNLKIIHNYATQFGGAVDIESGSSSVFTNILFANNKSAGYGAAVSTSSTPTVTFNNITFAYNTAVNGGAVNISGAPVFNNCIFWGNTATSGNHIYGGYPTFNKVCYSNNINDMACTVTPAPTLTDTINRTIICRCSSWRL